MKHQKNFKQLCLVLLCMFLVLTGVYGEDGQNRNIDEVTRLSALAKVWGLLKYYHPEVAKGQIDWDAVLISAVPSVKAAEDFESFNQEIDNLIVQAGDVTIEEYNPNTPAHPNEELFKWAKDSSLFDNDVRKKLKLVQKKHVPAENYYVQAYPYVGNTIYENEKKYLTPYYPDENYRLLALFRYWNIIQYFFPYKEDIGNDWEEVLDEFVPQLINAEDAFDYHLTIKELTTRIDDSHSFCSSPYIYYYFGYYFAPFELRYIEGKTIVTRVFASLMNSPDDVQVGDIILKRDSTDIDTFRNDVRKYVQASNEPTLERNINTLVLRGRSTQLPFTLLRNGQVINVTVPGNYASIYYDAVDAADNALDKWKILSGNIGYVHKGILEIADVDQMMVELMNTKAIIFDIRNYPRGTMYYISAYLNPERVEFVKFTKPDLDYPGSFNTTEPYETGPFTGSNPDYYKGRVVLLIDERTQSHAEFSTMSLQTAPDATIIGSQTAGADGNVSFVYLPGYIYAYLTGIGVYYPDGFPTQRIGIVPDIVIRPTVAGIQQGRDEVLEKAIDFIEN